MFLGSTAKSLISTYTHVHSVGLLPGFYIVQVLLIAAQQWTAAGNCANQAEVAGWSWKKAVHSDLTVEGEYRHSNHSAGATQTNL